MTHADIRPSPDLKWPRATLTPELEAMSRWADVNATFLTRKDAINTTTAAVCVVYPYLRTYTGSIISNQLTGRHISSTVMKVDMTNGLVPGAKNIGQFDTALNNPYYNYAAVKSPCVVNETICDLSHNMSTYPNATILGLFDLTYLGSNSSTIPERNVTRKEHLYDYTFRNVTAPEKCIYRQNSIFTMAISSILHTCLHRLLSRRPNLLPAHFPATHDRNGFVLDTGCAERTYSPNHRIDDFLACGEVV